jgi:O-antigen/teichoic acid export membrane protein
LFRVFAFNLSGRLLLVAISLISIPIYVRHIGVANYGIVGIYGSLATLAGIFDVAFSNTISRELARRGDSTVDLDGRGEKGEVFRTLELFAWLIAAALAVLVVVGARPLVDHWIGAEKYAGQNVVVTIRLMGLLMLFQAPVSFYSGCLYGMHRHAQINAINVIGTALSAALTIATMIFISPSIDAFFISQLVGRVGMVAALCISAYALLVHEVGWAGLRASLAVWKKLWRFAVGMNGIGLLSLLSNQADMVVLSRLLPATPFGYYTIARTVSQSMVMLAVPAYQSALPQLSQLANTTDVPAFARTFHRFCQYMSLVIIPPGVVIGVFSAEVLAVWTHDAVLAANASVTLSLLIAGSMVNGITYMLSAVQLANGALRLMVLLGTCFVVLIVPTLIVLVRASGATGAATALLLVNLVVTALSATLTLRRYASGMLGRWLTRDVLLPLTVCVLPAAILKVAVAGAPGSISAAGALVVAAVSAVVFTGLVLPEVRAAAVSALRRVRMSVR